MKNILSAAVTLIFLVQGLYAQKYPIRISSRQSIGQQYVISATGARVQEAVVTQAGRAIRKQSADYQVAFEGQSVVLAVDPAGEPYKLAYTVDKFTKTEGGVTTSLLKAGSVILVDSSQPEEMQIRLRGATAMAELQEAFKLVQPLHDLSSALNDNDIFGSRELKAIGESWPINAAAAAEDMRSSMKVPVERLVGKTSLVSKGTVAGNECLNLAAEIKGDGVALADSPPGFVGAPDGALRMSFRGCFPTNPAVFSRQEGAEVQAHFVLKGQRGTVYDGFAMEITIKQKSDVLTKEPASSAVNARAR